MKEKFEEKFEEKLNKQVTVIPATKVINDNLKSYGMIKKKRVAAYARVSTDEENQVSSYEAQIEYFKKYICEHDTWEFVDLYSDEGITGCSTKKRIGFNRMIDDALAGKIDLIVTKSMSRFARNTVDSISTIRNLKEHNVEVFFERENIWTMDSKGELLITILSSLAQEEARSISENSTWGQRKRFSDGKYSVAYSNFLGYDKDFKVNQEEAKVVRFIYDSFINGKTYGEIKHELENNNVLSPSGKKTWYIDVIKKILMNEKYCGDALLQKVFTSDFLTKTRKKNNGEIKQYYITDGHEAIISKEQFEIAQVEIKKREKIRKANKDLFAGKLYCKECGDKYYKCRSYLKDKNGNKRTYISYKCDSNGYGCTSKYINIKVVKDKFIAEFNCLDEATLNEIIEYSINDMNINDLKISLVVLDEKIKQIESLKNSILKTVSISKLNDEKDDIKCEIEKCELRIKKLRELKTLDAFDDEVFAAIINKVYIDGDKNVDIVFKGQPDTNEIRNVNLSKHLRKHKKEVKYEN